MMKPEENEGADRALERFGNNNNNKKNNWLWKKEKEKVGKRETLDIWQR